MNVVLWLVGGSLAVVLGVKIVGRWPTYSAIVLVAVAYALSRSIIFGGDRALDYAPYKSELIGIALILWAVLYGVARLFGFLLSEPTEDAAVEPDAAPKTQVMDPETEAIREARKETEELRARVAELERKLVQGADDEK